jgi:hypothetical protein
VDKIITAVVASILVICILAFAGKVFDQVACSNAVSKLSENELQERPSQQD